MKVTKSYVDKLILEELKKQEPINEISISKIIGGAILTFLLIGSPSVKKLAAQTAPEIPRDKINKILEMPMTTNQISGAWTHGDSVYAVGIGNGRTLEEAQSLAINNSLNNFSKHLKSIYDINDGRKKIEIHKMNEFITQEKLEGGSFKFTAYYKVQVPIEEINKLQK